MHLVRNHQPYKMVKRLPISLLVRITKQRLIQYTKYKVPDGDPFGEITYNISDGRAGQYRLSSLCAMDLSVFSAEQTFLLLGIKLSAGDNSSSGISNRDETAIEFINKDCTQDTVDFPVGTLEANVCLSS